MRDGFSALQRAEIAEIQRTVARVRRYVSVSVLFNEPKLLKSLSRPSATLLLTSFSALQRAEIAEMMDIIEIFRLLAAVSVLFNEPKLLKWSE